ncbi:hypothetical protein K501DRAFT_282784 [Backusella circina FSU 941]|nr:hypothetical protein K501DRAFT_282784 [Backusella circina FSU 941]
MAPAIKEEQHVDENKDVMDVDEETSEVEEQEESDEEMDEEPDLAVSADKIEIRIYHIFISIIVMFSPDVDFCGYSIPHPSVAKMNVRIQTTEKTNAIEALKTGLSNLHELVSHVRDAYAEDLEKANYVEFEEIA